jgi:hypothetical protein
MLAYLWFLGFAMDNEFKVQIAARNNIIALIEDAKIKYGLDIFDTSIYDGKICIDNIRFCGLAYEPIVNIQFHDEVDRLSSMFSGPFFTSEKHTWPKNSSGELAVPVVQIKLDELPINDLELSKFGVLQVWNFGVKNWLIKLIPLSEFDATCLSCLPDFENNNIVRIYGEDEMPWVKSGVSVIKGYSGPFFSCAFNEVFLEDDAPIELKKIKNFLDQINIDTRETQIFGTFELLQYDHDEVGFPLLMSMTDGVNGVYGFGAGGTGQIFIKKNGNDISFFMDSSC